MTTAQFAHPHNHALSAPNRAKVLDALRTGMKPCQAARAAGYQRTVLGYWLRRVEGFREAYRAARRHARFTRLAAVVRRIELGQTLTDALASEGRGSWWFYQRLPEYPDLYRRMYARRVDKRPAALAARVEAVVRGLDAGLFWGVACRKAGMSKTGWERWERTRPELYAALFDARTRNGIGPRCHVRGRWGTDAGKPKAPQGATNGSTT